ncbi:carnitine O-acetyltransferase-like isoform X1 [Drosophila sulfurigaster albostrigata]|uniref:carnitine O-acetyltransferase-like isoform X1 n=2 Tax=Drosophila sulfurigaster albostrigata TaxID=89887 RepID=UPI002D21A90B|nr:carnitine O-acetyltransferase-like isoform X1 [Drosophila sulfurigaster albostrigata]
MHAYQSAPVERKVQTPSSEMRLLSNSNKVFWNLTKLSISNQTPNVLVKLQPANYRSKSTDGGDGPEASTKQKLLTYPVLPLNETLQRFLLTAQPLLTPSEFEKQKKITQKFEENEGEKLQGLLEEVGKCEKNWLAHRWLTNAYLKYRDPVTVYVSPGMTFPYQQFKDMREYVKYTAQVIYGLGEFKGIVDAGEIPIVKMGKNELDNSQFGKVFGTCRIPIRGTDRIVYNPSSNYVVVIYKNHFYKLSLYDGEGNLLTSATLAKQLEEIRDAESDFGVPYGVLTTDSRDNWAEAYEQLVKNPENAATIKTIQVALFTVSMDECIDLKPGQETNQLILGLIHGNGSKVNSGNRWMDKTIQLVVNPNGNVGFTYEHSPAEGQPIAMMMDYVVKKMAEDADFGSCGSTNVECGPQKLSFAPLNDCVGQWLFYANRNIDKLVNDLQCNVLKFPCYGKNYIKKQKLGPDSFVQMALQLAFYKIHKVPAAQYESAHLRIFENGRTETIRSCSNESLAFCKAMTGSNVSLEEKAGLLRQAVVAHQQYAKNALQGIGVDRHLLGLKLMALENNLPVPEFYSSPGYTKSMHFRVSTSQVATLYDAFMGYGPATDDGYASCYNPRDDDIIVAITCWRYNQDTDPDKFAKALEEAFLDMQSVLEQTKKPKSKL